MLHAGGKFEAGNYKTAGGLHGVGASVVNALSKELVATVKRDGAQWEMRFKQGKPAGPLKKLGPARGSGTTVYFHPDPTIFPKIEFDAAIIRERLEVASYLHRGVKVDVRRRDRPSAKDVFQHEEGLVEYLTKIVRERGAKPVHEAPFVAAARQRPARSSSCCSGRSRPTSTCAATSTASRPAPAARTRTACAPGSARPSATTSRRTT